MTIVVFSEPTDVHAQSVIRELAKAGESDVRLVDLRDVPQRASVTMAFSNAHGSGFELAIGNGPPVRLDAVQSFWWRRPQTFVLPGGMDANSQHFALTELSTAFQGLWQ